MYVRPTMLKFWRSNTSKNVPREEMTSSTEPKDVSAGGRVPLIANTDACFVGEKMNSLDTCLQLMSDSPLSKQR
jgi:hypothetical protein